MAINVSQSFHRTSANPVDDTLTLTKAQMLTVNDNLMPAKYLTVCQDDGFIYLYDKSATPNGTTGKFTKFEGGGSVDISKLYSTDDTAETALADSDYIPFYDASASGKRKSLWSNIKSVLKTYFDTLYSTVKTSESGASGGTTLSLVTTGEKYNNETNIQWYATSSTAASTTAKTATLSRGTFTLVAGAKVAVKFTYSNTASTPTLNIGSTGAKNIRYYSGDNVIASPTKWWKAGETVTFIYDGSQYLMQPSYSIGCSYTVQTKTLAANATSCTFTGLPTSGNYMISLYTSDPTRTYTGVSQPASGQATYYFTAVSTAMTLYLKIEEV